MEQPADTLTVALVSVEYDVIVSNEVDVLQTVKKNLPLLPSSTSVKVSGSALDPEDWRAESKLDEKSLDTKRKRFEDFLRRPPQATGFTAAQQGLATS